MITRQQAELLLKESGGEKRLKDALEAREQIIELEQADPFRFGYEPPHWKDADELIAGDDELYIFGGNRSGKTEYCAKKAVKTLLEEPNARIWCFHTSHQSSLQVQQPAVYKYLPSEVKAAKKSKTTNVSYSQKNGFSDNTLVVNGSQITFLNYMQNPQVLEGAEVNLAWVDELCPASWIETIRFRLVSRQGKLLVSFTPIEGYTLTVKDLIAGGKVTESKESELLKGKTVAGCPDGHMPYIMETRRPRTHAIWFHTKMNPYNPYEELCKRLDGSTQSDIMIRAYGYATATVGNAFPRFCEKHLIAPDKIPKGTGNFMVVDPAGSRNWFMLWAREHEGAIYVYREWPDWRMGEWAVPGTKHDGHIGPAQRAGAGMSLLEYKNLIRELEKGEPIIMRLMDSRAATTPRDGIGSSYIESMLNDQKGEGPMHFDASSGRPIDEGVGMINDMLFWDKENSEDKPGLFVSTECKNLIYSLREWTGVDKERGATKDPVDCLRYLVQEDQLTVKPDNLVMTRGGSY